jgi:HEAT repeat protein
LGPNSPSSRDRIEGIDTTRWQYWWYYNSGPYLNLKTSIHAAAVTGDEDFYLGRGTNTQAGPGAKPTLEPLVSALLGQADSCDCFTMRGNTLLALAKLGSVSERVGSSEIQPVLRAALLDLQSSTAEMAAVSLGVCGDDSVAVTLANLLEDNSQGRELRRGVRVEERVRAFAGFALGLVGDQTEREDVRRFVVNKLCSTFEHTRSSTGDVRVACLLSLGLVPLESTPKYVGGSGADSSPSLGLESQVAWVLRVLDDEGLGDLVRAHAPTTLARLVQGQSADSELRRQVTERLMHALGGFSKAPREIQQSCAMALGQLADADDDPLDQAVRKLLMEVPKNVADKQTRCFALISLAQIGGRPGRGEGDALAGAGKIRSYFAQGLSRGKTGLKPWVALAVGVMERALDDARAPSSPEMRDMLRKALADARSPELVGALSISLGILRDPAGIPELLSVLERKNPETRAHAILALGMVGATENKESGREILRQSEFQPELVRNAAISLGLMRDRSVVPTLLEMLERETSGQRAVCRALSKVGDDSAVGALLELALDEHGTHATRGAAIEAIGGVGDLDDLPWNTALSVNTNYCANTRTLSDPMGGGVLDLY